MQSEAISPIRIVKRPAICNERAIATLAWGYGLTPVDADHSRPLLAIAWDKVIILMAVCEES